MCVDGAAMRNAAYWRQDELFENGYTLIRENQYRQVTTPRQKADVIWKKYHPTTEMCHGHNMSQLYWQFV